MGKVFFRHKIEVIFEFDYSIWHIIYYSNLLLDACKDND